MICTQNDTSNKKLGENVRCTYRKVGTPEEGGTCPDCCSLLETESCYAMYGYVSIHAQKDDGSHKDAGHVHNWLCSLPENKKVRHHVSGDLLTDGEIDEDYIDAIVEGHEQRDDLEGWGYTHAWRDVDPERINEPENLCFNASCEDADEMMEAEQMGWPTTLVVDEDADDFIIEKDGKTQLVVICPNQQFGKTCSECMLCAREDRDCAIGFRAHGTKKDDVPAEEVPS